MGEKIKHGQKDKILLLLETDKKIKQQGETAGRRERGGKDRLTTTLHVPRKTTKKRKVDKAKVSTSSRAAENYNARKVEKAGIPTLFMFRGKPRKKKSGKGRSTNTLHVPHDNACQPPACSCPFS